MSGKVDNAGAVIVGAGIAGVQAACALRESGYQERITLISKEAELPYDRPPLSKAALKEGADNKSFSLHPPDFYHDKGIDLFLGGDVKSIDRTRKNLALSGNENISYTSLVLATGSRVRELQQFPLGARNVFYLRTIEDATAIQSAFMNGGPVAMIGGGVIGLEVAAAAAARNISVHVIDPADRIMARVAPPPLSALLSSRHADHGVQLRCGVSIASAKQGRDGYRLTLSDGEILEAATIIVGVGVCPNTDLATDAKLSVNAWGIETDGLGRSADPAIFAAGEIAWHYNSRLGRFDKQENWRHAAAHGAHVGASIIRPAGDYNALSGYWTDQYDLSVQYFGDGLGDVLVPNGSLETGRGVLLHVKEDRIIGVTGVNAAREVRSLKSLILSRASLKEAEAALAV